MGRGKQKNVIEYCIDDITLQQVIGEKGLIKIKEYILNHDASCPPKRFTNSSDKRYLTHPEGRLNEKREAPNKVLVNMKGDSNTPPRQRKLFETKGIKIQAAVICDPGNKEETLQKNTQKNIKSTDCSPSSKKNKTNIGDLKCPYPVGKIIHSDTVAQTDQLHQKKNKKISILRRSTAYMLPKVKCDAVKKDTSKIRSIQQKMKSDTACPCIGKELGGIKSMLQKQSKKRQKSKRRRRSLVFSIWSQKENDEVGPVKLKSYKQTETKSRSVSPRCPKLKETAKLPKEITEVSCSCPSKNIKVQQKNIRARGICAEAYECKSLIDVKKLKSLITCMCKKSKKMLSKRKPPRHQPVCEPEICNKILKATIDNQKGEPKRPSKRKHKKLPKETETRERFIAIPENACDGTGDLIIRIKNPSNIKTKNVTTEQDKYSQMNTNQNNVGYRTGELLLKIKNNCNTKNKETVKKSEINKTIDANPKIAGYQSGEPLQIQVDPMNRCILNPDEIKYKLMNLSEVKNTTCVCPSRNARQEVRECKKYNLMNLSQVENTTCVCPSHNPGVCEGKICQKMFKDKKTNFNCKCQHIKDIGVECTDRTCGSKFIKRKYNKCSKLCVESPKLTEPQFEVQLDAKRMCILNSDEVNKKIIEKEAEVYETCPGGTCAIACEKGNIFKCTCVQKRQDIGECTNRTCVDTETEKQAVDLWYYMISKLLSKVPVSSRNKMRRSPFDTNEIKKIKSVFSLIRERLKRTPEIWDGSEATKKTSCSLSGLKPQQNYTVNYSNYHRRSGLKLPLQRSRQIRTSTTRNVAQPKSFVSSSPSSCGCSKELEKEKKTKKKENKKNKKKKKKKKDNSKSSRKMRKEMARQQKLERKKRAKEEKQLKKEMLWLEKVDEAGDTNCLADCILGICGIGLGIIQCFLMSMFKMITKPKKSYATIREWMREPMQTFSRVQKWIKYKWRVQKFHMSRSIKGSDTMTTILDEVKESKYYKTFATKGKTNKERQAIESQSRRRQRRMRQKASRALHGCRDILLLTMRKRPWLWVYHICPDFYPRCLGLRRSFIQVLQLLMFCCAIIVWTPCILCMELCRGFMCCFTCSTL